MQQNMTSEAYRREYQAEFTEAASSYFQQELIRKCIEHAQSLGLEPYTTIEQQIPKAQYYAGLDLGKLRPLRTGDNPKRPRRTQTYLLSPVSSPDAPYTEVINTLTRADEKFRFQKLLADQTGLGEPILESLQQQGVICAEGAKLTQDAKTEILTHLKLAMEQNHLAIPYNKQLCQQINDQQYQYTKNGKLTFNHPPNTHDDMLWALALAVYAAKTENTPKLWVIAKTSKSKSKLYTLRKKLLIHIAQGENR